jgi:gluconolactonase
MEIQKVTDGLAFPEGPVALDDGSVLVCEIHAGLITRVRPDGSKETVADVGGGPNGAALGPDGALYVVNNGGFLWSEIAGMTIPLDLATGVNEPEGFTGGWVDRIDLDTGEVTRLYDEVEGHRLHSPNDIVFDEHGGFWFTDLGKVRALDLDRGALYYAQPDGSSVTQPIHGPPSPSTACSGPTAVASPPTARPSTWPSRTPVASWRGTSPARARSPRRTGVSSWRRPPASTHSPSRPTARWSWPPSPTACA